MAVGRPRGEFTAGSSSAGPRPQPVLRLHDIRTPDGGLGVTRWSKMASPRLYDDLAWVWPLLSPPEHYPEEASELASAFREAGVGAGGRILHLGCGGGSLDTHLKAQFRVTGIDVSASMLDHARRTNPDVEYIEGDILTARLGRTFDGVLLHDAQAYFTRTDQLRAAYDTAAVHLRPGGVMVSAPEELRHRFRQDRVHDSVTLGDANMTVTTVEIDHDPDVHDSAFDRTFLFLIRDADGQRVEMDVHRLGLWNLEEMLVPMREAGFIPEVSEPKLSDMEEGEWVLVTAKRQ